MGLLGLFAVCKSGWDTAREEATYRRGTDTTTDRSVFVKPGSEFQRIEIAIAPDAQEIHLPRIEPPLLSAQCSVVSAQNADHDD